MNSQENCSLEQIRELFLTKKNIAIITHEHPDADALSSIVVLKYQLENYFNSVDNPKVVDIYADTFEVSELYEPILKKDNLNGQKVLGRYDLVIGLDCPNQYRFGSFKHLFDMAYETLNIDHHDTNAFFADHNFVFNTSSTSELLYIIMSKLGVEMTDTINKLIYAGIITDTNNLTQGNISARTYNIINKMIKNGVDISKIQEHFFKNNSLSKIKLLERAISSLRFASDGKIAVMKLNKTDYLDCGADPETDTLGLVDYAIGLKDVKIAMILMRQDDNSYKISLRSKEGINVGEIAKQFGGGGHDKMAVFNAINIADFKDDFLKICNQEFSKLGTQEESTDNLFFSEDELRDDQNNFDF